MIAIDDPRIKSILTYSEEHTDWEKDLARFRQGDVGLTRHSAGESSIKALQRMLVFLGYSTTSRGAFKIDGDFGRGTNRGLAQFQYDHSLSSHINREILEYPCKWSDAYHKIDSIPDAVFDQPTLEKMVDLANENLREGRVMCGDFDEAIRHINAVHSGRLMNCLEITEHYADHAYTASARLLDEKAVHVHPLWILAIIKQETSGIVRPRFEQHYLSRLGGKEPDRELREIRFLSMSQGLGQIMGSNYKAVGATSPEELFTSPIEEQVLHVARFLSKRNFRKAVSEASPQDELFHVVGKNYNGPGYAKHHYHESLKRWFREFSTLL